MQLRFALTKWISTKQILVEDVHWQAGNLIISHFTQAWNPHTVFLMLPWWCTLISITICMHWAPWTDYELWVFCDSDHFGGTRTHKLMKTAFWNRNLYGALSDYRHSKMWLHRVARQKWGDMRQKWSIWHNVMAIHLDIKLWDFKLNNNVNCICNSYLKCADHCLMTTWAQWQWISWPRPFSRKCQSLSRISNSAQISNFIFLHGDMTLVQINLPTS